jgi:hypothetical protein
MVCYYESASAQLGYYSLRHMKAKLCTHIVYSSIGIANDETLQYDETVDLIEGE